MDFFHHQTHVVAALEHDGTLQFPPQRMVAGDAEIAADVGDDGADGPAADHRIKMLWGWAVAAACILPVVQNPKGTMP